MSLSYTNQNFGDMSGFEDDKRSKALRVAFWIFIILIIFFFITTMIWFFWYRSENISYGHFLSNMLSKILSIALWPIKFLFSLLGLTSNDETIVPGLPQLKLPEPSKAVTITKHEIGTCPPCEVDVQCPPCNDHSADIKPLELEIKYLKDMVKFVGSIAKRENSINAQYRELYPGISVLSPHVRKLSHEYNYIKDEIRKDKDEWQYFKNYFTKLTNIPSTTGAIQYDVELH